MGGSPGMGEVLDGWGRLFMAGGRNGRFYIVGGAWIYIGGQTLHSE
jgi:hypothetical protein